MSQPAVDLPAPDPAVRKALETRFLRYVQIDTQSDEASSSVPSTAKQFDLLRLLQTELRALGITDLTLHDYGALIATLPAHPDHPEHADAPRLAFLAHVDTAPQFTGTNVQPIVHRNYAGGALQLPADPRQVLDPAEFPYLNQCIGHDLVTSSGDTLLGGDDKAGVAIIVTLAELLLQHPELPRPTVRLCFTTDEEIGRGVRHLQLDDLRADVAYTLDGMDAGQLDYETFSADRAVVTINGVSTHPATAKGVMVNALHLAAKLINLLPQDHRTPETTELRQGFIHLYQMEGGAAQAKLNFILRDFELDGLAAHGELLRAACAALEAVEPRAQITCEISAQYRNMRYWLEKNMRPVDLARTAIDMAGLTRIEQPIRGGTDGSQLTEKGVPCPNLFTGMQNVHGPREWISLQDMALSTQVCLNLAGLWAKEKPGA
ncbi:MAG: peptidase T [Litorilinea sp.]